MTTDPRELVSNSRMSALQIVAVALTVGLNALDGFDVLSIAFASPGIAAEWGMDRGALGIVLSMELVGMALGSLFLGGVADRIGRRPTILGCLVVMSGGMYMATTVHGIFDLSLWRVLTGVGIGGMLAAINAATAEFANTRRRHLCISMTTIGYPLGAVLGGMAAAALLKNHDWRAVFYFGAAVTAAFIPLVFWFVPESVHWLAHKQPEGALDKINRTLKRMGHAAVAALPAIGADARQRSMGEIFQPSFIGVTLLVTAAYFFHFMTLYFLLKWVPQIVVGMGFVPSSAAGVLVWANAGGALGGATFGLLTQKFGIKQLTIVMMVLSAVAVVVFGRSPPDLQRLSLYCAVAGFCINAGIVGMYAIFAQAFPTHVRASGTGFGIGIGRGGAVLAPIVAGFLFKAGYGLPAVATTMALGSLLAAGMLLMLKLKPHEPAAEGEKNAAALKGASVVS